MLQQGKRHEDKRFIAGELPMRQKLFITMCAVKLEAVPFAIRIGFLSSMGGGIAATVFADTIYVTRTSIMCPLFTKASSAELS